MDQQTTTDDYIIVLNSSAEMNRELKLKTVVQGKRNFWIQCDLVKSNLYIVAPPHKTPKGTHTQFAKY